MKIINEFQQKNVDFDEYTKKLGQIKKRVQGIHATILAVEVLFFQNIFQWSCRE